MWIGRTLLLSTLSNDYFMYSQLEPRWATVYELCMNWSS